jgi:hypothetical protein
MTGLNYRVTEVIIRSEALLVTVPGGFWAPETCRDGWQLLA